MNYFKRVLATDKGANIVQNICLTEQSLMSKITTDCLKNFSRSLYARMQSLKEYRLVAMESFSIDLEEAIAHKCTKQSCFQNVGEKAASSNSV